MKKFGLSLYFICSLAACGDKADRPVGRVRQGLDPIQLAFVTPSRSNREH